MARAAACRDRESANGAKINFGLFVMYYLSPDLPWSKELMKAKCIKSQMSHLTENVTHASSEPNKF